MKKWIFRATFSSAAFLGLALGVGIHSSQAFSFQAARLVSPLSVPDQASPVVLQSLFHESSGVLSPYLIVVPPAQSPYSDLGGRITDPAHCQIGLPAGVPIQASGTIQNIPPGVYLWVFVYAANARYYPQCNDALAGQCGVEHTNGAWSVTVYLGRAGVKEHFHLVLVETNGSGNDFLIGKMKEWAEEGFFPGLLANELKDYMVKELDSIQVETAGQ